MEPLRASLRRNGIVVTAVILHALVLFCSTADAVSIGGYTTPTTCTHGYVCRDIASNQCCELAVTNAVSVAFWEMYNGDAGYVFNQGGCTSRLPIIKLGPGDFCITGGGRILSARYVANRGRPVNLAPSKTVNVGEMGSDDEVPACNSTVLPDAIMYSPPDSSGGAWLLSTGTGNAHAAMKQLDSISDEEKVAWLQNAGAEFSQTTFSVVEK